MVYKFPKTTYKGDELKIREEVEEFFEELYKAKGPGKKLDKKAMLSEALDSMMAINTYIKDHFTEDEINKGMQDLIKKLHNRGVVIGYE